MIEFFGEVLSGALNYCCEQWGTAFALPLHVMLSTDCGLTPLRRDGWHALHCQVFGKAQPYSELLFR